LWQGIENSSLDGSICEPASTSNIDFIVNDVGAGLPVIGMTEAMALANGSQATIQINNAFRKNVMRM
jgi:hypothetical protein